MKIKPWQIGLAGAGTAALIFGLSSCATLPKGAKAVRPFYIGRYLGKWYEIARLDFRFEKNLDHVTANYSLNRDQTIRVDNKGYDKAQMKWKESIGKAKFVNAENEGRLKVSFFGPFYAGYNVIAINDDYNYAMVVGNNLKYLWLLSRDPTMPATFITKCLKHAQELGYDVSKLVWTNQGR
ncbi:lipocalin family protein [Mucilaginibacter ginkgonis]|uniref:Outer membrane lipoprotein Blc n=1 Tax=Mucilaginibacter ginkgonis TaxID=2682091 RepID=A0A6I4HZQ0_9SPHI|nr:lipocalin family protein [Mucilaginibacter ginkgonis]QQL49946.1 lipocalin family protein [Mucilaginibacter ginkgonis]